MQLSPGLLLLLVCAGAATGVLGAILGTGGGVFLIPMLVIAAGMPIHHAVATSIVTVIATSSAAASTNVERGTANMRLGMTLEVATALGAIAGGLTAVLIYPRLLEGLFSAVLLPVAFMMWRGRAKEAGNDNNASASRDDTKTDSSESLGALGASYTDERTGNVVRYRMHRLGAGLGISFLAGNVSGLLGIGGGVLKVPALHLVCRIPIRAAAATSNFMIGVTAAASAFLYYGRGEVYPAPTAAVTLGVLGGSAIGSKVSHRVHGKIITKLFAIVLLAVSLQMLYRAISGVE